MLEALLAEIYQVQSAMGQMTGYPEIETAYIAYLVTLS